VGKQGDGGGADKRDDRGDQESGVAGAIRSADGRMSRASAQHYRRMVEYAIGLGSRPTPTLFHFGVPQRVLPGSVANLMNPKVRCRAMGIEAVQAAAWG
jgi:hypothetical protein